MMVQEIERKLSLCSFSNLKTNQGFYILTEKRSYGRKKIFVKEEFLEEAASICRGLFWKAKDLRSENKVAKVVHDRLIVHKKESVYDISEVQEDP